jgi:Co/Zn/Cd efflux system component
MWVQFGIVAGGCVCWIGYVVIALLYRHREPKNGRYMGMLVVGALGLALNLCWLGYIVLIERR